ncbi:TetR/AcrR family transcriptional regulator [Burkholderia metallica]|uniref:TetR/AcrR family transcriptional regulator n=1 Tax=Burkholderia metallica TaxID=488729 RepID=UPI0015753110|nr:TetR/AcrR family transcriptional regulator [Burkholderia metallica]NTZ05995.1 TetR/AcrR family transcriptional regulator [Burkholderia metallica]
MKPARLTRTQRQLHTRERLVAAARDCFIARGFADTTVEHIAEHAGYTRGAFYANFGHKRELLVEILRRDRPHLLARMRGSAHARWSSSTADDAMDIAAEWECFPLWVAAHLYALRDAALRQIVDRLHAEPVPRATASGTADIPENPERMPSSAEWAALLGVALSRAGARHAPRDEPA